MRVIKDLVYLSLIGANYIISFLPRKKSVWVFGAWHGDLYADNSKYMFEYVSKYHSNNINAIWISRKTEVVDEVRKRGFKAYKCMTFMGAIACLKAGVVFLTEDRHDVSRVLISGATIIQLWHGMGIKDITKFFPTGQDIVQKKYDSLIHSHRNEMWMVASEEAKKKYMDAFSLPEEHIYITGQPKDDTFIHTVSNAMISEIRLNHPDCKIVTYLPTHRKFGGKGSEKLLSNEQIEHVNSRLKKNNIIMIFKPHKHEFKNYIESNKKFSNVIFATDSQIYGDVYEFLPACDMMITDYSGIMFGYLASEKPIIFFAYDYDEYISTDAGFCYSYEEVTPGPICKSWDEVIDVLSELYLHDSYVDKRYCLKKKFCPMADGSSCERIFATVQEILGAND